MVTHCKIINDEIQYIFRFNYDHVFKNPILGHTTNTYLNSVKSYYIKNIIDRPWEKEKQLKYFSMEGRKFFLNKSRKYKIYNTKIPKKEDLFFRLENFHVAYCDGDSILIIEKIENHDDKYTLEHFYDVTNIYATKNKNFHFIFDTIDDAMDEAIQFIHNNPEYFTEKLQKTKGMGNSIPTEKQIFYIKTKLPKQYKEKLTKLEAYQIIRQSKIEEALIKCYKLVPKY